MARMLQKFLRERIASQFGKPSGFLGRIAEKRMSRRTSTDAEWTVSLLPIQPTSRMLEIGFGGGVSTQLASQRASQGFIAGIDHSETMVNAASQRNIEAIRAGRMELKAGDAGSVPYPDESFDIVFSLHSIYFWKDPLECLKGFKRVLKPGGLLAITIQPKNKWRKEQVDASGMTLFFADQVADLCRSADFRNIRIEAFTKDGEIHLQCIIGNK
jgi:ubiquinone/menaquinone biosynthesis C-methylase UbiE